MKKLISICVLLVSVFSLTSALAANEIKKNQILIQPKATMGSPSASIFYPTDIFIYNKDSVCIYLRAPALGFDGRKIDQYLCPGYYQELIGYDYDNVDVYFYYNAWDSYPFMIKTFYNHEVYYWYGYKNSMKDKK